jgi:autotransporter-associated beta strand protein
MNPVTPHDPLDDLIAAALHGELTPEERAQFESRLAQDPAAQTAYQEAQAMNDLLEKTHQSAQPTSDFEQRMVYGVRRKLQTEQHRETAWESALALWQGLKKVATTKRRSVMPSLGFVIVLLTIAFLLAGISLGPITSGIKKAQQSADMQEAHAKALADYQAQVDAGNPNPVMRDIKDFMRPPMPDASGQVKGVFSTISSQLAVAGSSGEPSSSLGDTGQASPVLAQQKQIDAFQSRARADAARLARLNRSEASLQDALASNPNNEAAAKQLSRIEAQKRRLTLNGGSMTLSGANTYTGGTTISGGSLTISNGATITSGTIGATTSGPGTIAGNAGNTFATDDSNGMPANGPADAETGKPAMSPAAPTTPPAETGLPGQGYDAKKRQVGADLAQEKLAAKASSYNFNIQGVKIAANTETPAPAVTPPPPADTTPAVDDRKLIRNAQLDLEVKSYQNAVDEITALTKAAGGYVDTSNSQRGGNGKLQGTVAVKVLPQNLDAFLLKLRDLGEVKNQSVSTDDVTKDYFDTQARLVNSQKMETQLQDLLKRENGKVSDLLAVERELGRVRGEIEGMQGQLKLYDFQVQYATVTIQLAEKDLKQTAAYLLKEQDDFSLFATDVEGTFQNARKAADDFKAQVLVANLNHNSGSDVSATLIVSVPPDQIEPFLAQVRALGRVANFTRDTKRIAQDGGDSAQPADQTLTEKDKVMVNISVRSDDETRKQVAMTVVTKTVDDALDQAKAAALAQAGTAILASSLNKTAEGQSTAQLSVRVPGKEYAPLMDAFRALGRTASLSVQRNDNAGPGANGDDAPVIVSLALTDDDAPLQTTEMSVVGTDIDEQSQQIKKDAAAAGVEVKASSFVRQPDGTELAQMTFRMPMSKYVSFTESLKKLGRVESLSVQRSDRPDETRTDDSAPAEINLQLHNERGIVADDNGLFATLRHTFGQGADALFASVRVIGVLIAFLLPWVVTVIVVAWIARRIYIWRKK